MPNAFVFPGGVLAKEDLHPSWLDLLPKPLKPPPEGPRPFLMQPAEQTEGLPRHIAFRWGDAKIRLHRMTINRIAAIRETFEESGVLLLQPDDSGRMPVLEASEWVCCHFVKILPIWSPEETAEWRLKVQNDPGQLLELCRCLLTVSYSSNILHLLQISWGNSRFVGFIWMEWLAHSYQPAGDPSKEGNTEVGRLKPMKDLDPNTENWDCNGYMGMTNWN